MKKKILLLFIFTLFIGISLGTVFANETTPTTENLTTVENPIQTDNLNSIEIVNNHENKLIKNENNEDKLDIIENFNSNLSKKNKPQLSACENYSSEALSTSINTSKEVLSSSISISSNNGHTYHKLGYTFKVSPQQYKKIKSTISVGKKQKFLKTGYEFKVKTNKIYTYKKPIYKTKKVTKYKWIYKKASVSQEKYWNWEYRFHTDKTVNGWKCYRLVETDFEYGIPYKHIVYLKKKVKYKGTKKIKTGKYKKVKMRVYAYIDYVGSEDYYYGEHSYFPWVSFEAMKKGYKSIYLEGILLK